MADGDIIPYFVYYSLDSPMTRISYGSKDFSPLSIVSFCNSPTSSLRSSTSSRWQLGMVFYALRPDFFPIPHGMSLISASFFESPPYHTTHVEIISDPFHLHKNTVNFITYYSPVSNTIPLYLYELPNKVIFALGGNEGRRKDILTEFISPIFVMWGFYISINNFEIDNPQVITNFFNYRKFSCIENRCVPDKNGILIRECLNKCSSSSLYFLPDSEEPQDPRLKKFQRKNWGILILTIIIILIIIFILVYILTR